MLTAIALNKHNNCMCLVFVLFFPVYFSVFLLFFALLLSVFFLSRWLLTTLKSVSATILLVCFLSLHVNTYKTRKNVYFTSKALFVLEKIRV